MNITVSCLISSIFINPNMNDTIIWDASANGAYSTELAYKWITEAYFTRNNLLDVESLVWQLPLPENVKLCPSHNDFLVHRFVSFDHSCNKCGSSNETTWIVSKLEQFGVHFNSLYPMMIPWWMFLLG